jgi:hypothetical protein
VWAFADPELEALSAAEKHLLRMGPENARQVQEKLSELAELLGYPAGDTTLTAEPAPSGDGRPRSLRR